MGSRALGLKDVLFEVLPDADSGVLDHKPVAGDPVPAGDLLHLDKGGAMGTVVFDGVVNDVHEDLL